ncbi:microsomal triacylglycerol transfer protein [Daktulosphaira vitifoliae]|uniref:microsomal triacylglycerol transfer protein n=1 Tax=Daktulosphaira vitifoliae TaxID=58002 RepID=UPI0021A9D8E2|nr:microsomal triacylglycerol transfer protein [Daktulosphaira vitifoliae]
MFSDRETGSRSIFLLTVCLSAVRSPAAALAAGDPFAGLFLAGNRYVYGLSNTLLLDESYHEYDRGIPIGHRITAQVQVDVVWHRPEHGQLLCLKANEPLLQTHSKRLKFIDRAKSKLVDFNNSPFCIQWKNGRIESVYVTQDTTAEKNFKKGIANLFQFQLFSADVVEDSTLGRCNVTYSKITENTILKRINRCSAASKRLIETRHPEKILQGILRSKRQGLVKFSNKTVTEITFEEDHEFYTELLHETGASVVSKQILKLNGNDAKIETVKADSLSDAIKIIEKQLKQRFVKEQLTINHEVKNCKYHSKCPKLKDVVKKYHDDLIDTELGMSKSAFAAIKVIDALRNSNTDAIVRVLKDKENEDIEFQLYDLLGSALTEDSHKAAMDTLNFSKEDDYDKAERYLWSASVKFNPNINIIQSLRKLSQKKLANKKLEDTVYNTVTAMISRLTKYETSTSNLKLFDEILQETLAKLTKCNDVDDDECRLVYIRALTNLQHPKSIEVLLDIAQNGNRKSSTSAIKAIKIFGPSFWDGRVLKACDKIFFQLIKERDSSVRMIALSILLESGPDYDLLKNVAKWLLIPDEGFENKQYTVQLLNEMANQNQSAAMLFREVLINEKLNHYGVLAQRGLSSSFSRKFFSYNNITGLVKSSQHIYTGVTKRGSVDIIMEHENNHYHLCNLGMFTTGLGYFSQLYDDSPNKKEPTEEDNLPATAGLEITVFGVHIRPFMMFTSQGQLMGHVWAGSASERTPVVQGIYQMMEHQEYLSLSSGYIADLNLKGTVSLDIAGQIQMSLWNKNAQSLIEQNGGISINGVFKLNSDVVSTEVEFTLKTEGLMHTYSDAEFAKKVALCMQIVLVDTNMTSITAKNEIVYGYPREIHKVKTRVHKIAGRTFALNKLANEFCNEIHAQ